MAPSESMGPPNPTRQRALIGADVLAKIKRLQRFWGGGGLHTTVWMMEGALLVQWLSDECFSLLTLGISFKFTYIVCFLKSFFFQFEAEISDFASSVRYDDHVFCCRLCAPSSRVSCSARCAINKLLKLLKFCKVSITLFIFEKVATSVSHTVLRTLLNL